jgi:hypothetical protein
MGILDAAKSVAGMGLGAGQMAMKSFNGMRSVNRMTMGGAAIGAGYGATFGRDPGQSRFGGAMTGAMGGAAMGRYGSVGVKGMVRGMSSGASTFGARMTGMGRGAGMRLFAQARSDGRAARRFIGNSLTRANNGINRIRSTISG